MGSTVCCPPAYIGADGRLLGNHRKLVPTQAERLVWGCGDGSDLEVYDTALGRLGGLNCFEHQMAPARYVLCEMGEQVHAAAWLGHAFIDGIVDASTRHLAHENGCFVVVAREVMSADRVAAALPRPDRTAAHFHTHGGSAIIAPGGDYLAGPVFDIEAIVTAEIDLARIGVIKWFFDGTGHYARPGVCLLDDVLASLNAGELAQRRFREVARVSGLIFQGYPGAPKSMKQLQASSSLFYEVFRKHDPGNMLLAQAEREVLEQELELERLRQALARMRRQKVHYRLLTRPTPFAFPLMVERFREQVTTEALGSRIERMLADLERAAGC